MEALSTLQEQPATYDVTTPQESEVVSPDIQRMAHEAVKNFHECFWWWNPEALITTRADVLEVIRTLRMGGGHRAWWAAQALQKCL